MKTPMLVQIEITFEDGKYSWHCDGTIYNYGGICTVFNEFDTLEDCYNDFFKFVTGQLQRAMKGE